MLPWLCCCSSSTKGRALTWECCAHRLRWLAPFSWQRVTVQMRELCTACFPSFGVQCFILCHTVCSPSDLEVWKLQALIAFSLELVAGLSWEPGVILSECWLFLLFLAASVSSVLKTSCFFFCFFSTGAITTTFGRCWCMRAQSSTRSTPWSHSTQKLLFCEFLFLPLPWIVGVQWYDKNVSWTDLYIWPDCSSPVQ